MSEPSYATTALTIDIDAVVANYRLLADRARPARCAAVAKADAYGLGASRLVPALAAAGCETFFIATLDEGIAMRALVPQAEIVVLNGPMPGEPTVYREHRLLPTLNSLGQVELWSRYCHSEQPLPAAIQLDTGMSRLGLPRDEADTLATEPDRMAGIPCQYMMSHLACADTPDHPLNREQLARFEGISGRLPPAPRSLAASSGIFLGADFLFDLVRPGICLYGGRPDDSAPNPMRPVVRLTAKILQIRHVDAPQTVGYGATYRAAGPTRVATIAVGYADGYLRSLSGVGEAFIGNTAVPVIGRVSMDLVTLDVSDVPSAVTGDPVDLIGPMNDVDSVAQRAGTISYEILTALGQRHKRSYIGGNA